MRNPILPRAQIHLTASEQRIHSLSATMTPAEIVTLTGLTASTVRNVQFKIREKLRDMRNLEVAGVKGNQR